METHEAILLFVCGLVITLVVTPVVLRLTAGGLGADSPDHFRKSHEYAVCRLGGLPIFLSLLATIGCAIYFQPKFLSEWWPLLLCNLLIFTVGFIDDLKPLGARVKFVAQIAIAFLAYSLGLRIDILGSPVGSLVIDLGGFSLFATLLWLVALPNIINLIDGMDGLASGVGMFLCLTLGIVGLISNNMEVAVISLGMAGALLGFLFYNFPPAKIFLGDGGAYLIGFFIGSVSLASSNKGSIAAALLVVLVALGLPILDTAFAILRRGARGLPLFRADAEHIHHRLLVLGFSKSTALIAMYAVCVVLSLIGVSIFWSKGQTLPIAGAFFFILTLVAARYLGYIGNWSQLRTQWRRAMDRRKDVQYAHLLGQVLEIELDRFEDPKEYWDHFDKTLGRLGFIQNSKVQPEQLASGELVCLEIPLDQGGNNKWVLYHPPSANDNSYWGRIADCFHPAYAQALSRFHAADPPAAAASAPANDELPEAPPLSTRMKTAE